MKKINDRYKLNRELLSHIEVIEFVGSQYLEDFKFLEVLFKSRATELKFKYTGDRNKVNKVKMDDYLAFEFQDHPETKLLEEDTTAFLAFGFESSKDGKYLSVYIENRDYTKQGDR